MNYQSLLKTEKHDLKDHYIISQSLTCQTYTSIHTHMNTHSVCLIMYECPSLRFFDLLIMIKLVGVWWLVVAQWRVPWVLYYTASHLGPEKKTTKWRCKDDRRRLKTAGSQGRKEIKTAGKILSAISLSITLIYLGPVCNINGICWLNMAGM